MKKNIFSLGMNLKRGAVNRAASLALAGVMLFSTGAGIMEANAFSLDKPTFSYTDYLGYKGTKIFINGRFVEFNNQTGYPMSVKGTTYIPVSVLENAFNANIYFSNETNRIFISKHGARLTLYVDSNDKTFVPDLNKPMKDRIETTAKNQSFISNGIVYVPLREVFESFGAKVIWNGSTKSISIVSDYEKNSANIDFKDEKVLALKDVDLGKKYSKIIYDGQEVDADYLKLLLNSNEHKVIEQKGVLYVFSYQYLMDVNYIYGVHIGRKNNLDDRDTAYKLWSVTEKEYDYAKELVFLDSYSSFATYKPIDMDMSGYAYSLMSLGNKKEFEAADEIINEIVSRVKSKTNDSRKMVELVNDELCDLINVHSVKSGESYPMPSVYTAIVEKDGICDGYAIAFKYIMDKLGIPCIRERGMVRGTIIPHAWNEVYVDGEWKIIDVFSNDLMRRDRCFLVDIDDSDFNNRLYIDEDSRLEAELTKLTLKLNNNGKTA